MREIKFRAWDKKNKKTNQVYLINFDFTYVECIRQMQSSTGYMVDAFSLLQFNEIELMQYTGLKDITDKDIYEGDIIQSGDSNWKGEVRYDEGSYWINDHVISDISSPIVIGNIYENPELLEDKK